MMARRSHGGKVIDFKAWLAMLAVDSQVSTAGTAAGGFIDFTSPATILRCRGYVQGYLDPTKQVGDTMALGFAIGIVSTDARGAGVLPDPFEEPEYPWLWHGTMFLRAEIAAGAEAWGLSAQRLEVDTKAMRRIKPGQSLVYAIERASVAGAPVTEITTGFTRVLIGT